MLLAARTFVWPSFDFRGARALTGYGGVMMAGQLFWFVQTQSDILIAGRSFTPTELGFYTTALFLAQIFVTKVVPPLNEVAFSAYTQIQHDREAVAANFLKSVRVVMTLAMPFCLGLAAVAEPAVHVLLGDKWLPAAPIVAVLALAMPFMTLHVMFGPATNACGRPGIGTRSAILGAVLMPVCYLAGARYGATGIAASWLIAWPLLTAIAAAWSMPVLGVRAAQLRDTLLPPMFAGAGMWLAVTLLDKAMPAMPEAPRLALLVAAGGAVYGGWLFAFARERLNEIVGLALKR
jgi:O-antigen/teichoic acid export membrane protein